MSSSLTSTFTKARSLPSSVKRWRLRSGCCETRPARASPTVFPGTLTEACFPAYWRRGDGIWIWGIQRRCQGAGERCKAKMGLCRADTRVRSDRATAAGKRTKVSALHEPDLLVLEFLIGFIGAHQFERIGDRRLTFPHAGDHVGTAKPVRFRQIGDRPLRGVVGVGVIEADDILAALAALALNADEFPGIDVVAVVGRVRARVAAAGGARDGLRAVIVEPPEQHTTALAGIGFLAVLTKKDIGGLREAEHQKEYFTTEAQSHGEKSKGVVLCAAVSLW